MFDQVEWIKEGSALDVGNEDCHCLAKYNLRFSSSYENQQSTLISSKGLYTLLKFSFQERILIKDNYRKDILSRFTQILQNFSHTSNLNSTTVHSLVINLQV